MIARVRIGDQQSPGIASVPTPSHDAILDAAIRCFLPLGYGATSMEAVAREAGVTTSTIFHQFVGKEALFREAVAHVWRALPVVRVETEQLAMLTVETALQQVGHAVAAFWSAPLAIGLVRMLLAEEQRFPDLVRSFVETDIEPMTTGLVSYLQCVKESGVTVQDPALAARQFLGLINEPLLWSRVIGNKTDSSTSEEREQTVNEAVATFISRYTRT